MPQALGSLHAPGCGSQTSAAGVATPSQAAMPSRPCSAQPCPAATLSPATPSRHAQPSHAPPGIIAALVRERLPLPVEISENAVELRSSGGNEYSWTVRISQYSKRGQGREALRVFQEMQKEGVEPSPRTFVAVLKACSILQDLENAKRIHAEVVRSGFKTNLYVGTMLIDVYAKCKSLVDARHVFEMMPYRDVVSWNAMILGYAKMQKSEEALLLYTRMQQEGVVPNDRTYVSALKACSSLAEFGGMKEHEGRAVKERCLETVKAIHRDIVGEAGVFVGTMLVDAYIKCGSLENSSRVFENMPHRDVVSWNAMILGYAQMHRGEEALQLYTQMQQQGVVPNDRTYVSALKACSTLIECEGRNEGKGTALRRRCLETVRAIHANVVKRKFESDLFVGNILVDVYAKCRSLEDAWSVFEKMHRRDVVSWTAMILGYAQMNKGAEALQLYTQMQQEGVVPNDRAYVGALKACSVLAESGRAVKEKCLETVRAIHTDIMKANLDSDVFVGNILVDVYAKCESLEDSRCVFEMMPHRDVVSWNAMIFGYAQMDKGVEALQLYTRMQEEGMVPDDRTHVSALKACSNVVGSYDRYGSDGRLVTERCLETVRAIHSNVRKGMFESDVFVGNMLVDVYAKCGSLEDARRVFENMPHRDVISWTAIVLGYVQVDKGQEALQLYTRMQQEGVLPNDRTYVGALKACGSVAALEQGKQIHAQILQNCLGGIDSFVASSLIDMYGSCGSMVDAQNVFDALPTKDTVAWNALIAGYAHWGESELVFELFERMKQEGIQPHDVTFLGVLAACCHMGLVDRGHQYFEDMRDYGITPTIKHFTCVADLLGRSGQLEKAMEIVKEMPFQPDSAVWGCILSACRKWGNVELGRHAFECAVKLNKDDAAAYVLMSNIYAAAHMQQEAKEIQEMRVRLRAWKQPGWSRWTDGRGNVHVFVVGDQGHVESQHIYANLRALLVKMKKEGFVPHIDSNVAG